MERFKKGTYLSTILRSGKTVFSVGEIKLLWGETNASRVRVRLNYYARSGALYRIRRGFYAKDNNYNKLELATKIFTPSYVSFETVLAPAGVIFQYYSQIFVASYLTREIDANTQSYSYKKLRNAILTNSAGIQVNGITSIASQERAFLDVVYLYKDYHFDNLAPLDWKRVKEILPIYDGNRRMENKVKGLFKDSSREKNNS